MNFCTFSLETNRFVLAQKAGLILAHAIQNMNTQFNVNYLAVTVKFTVWSVASIEFRSFMERKRPQSYMCHSISLLTFSIHWDCNSNVKANNSRLYFAQSVSSVQYEAIVSHICGAHVWLISRLNEIVHILHKPTDISIVTWWKTCRHPTICRLM